MIIETTRKQHVKEMVTATHAQAHTHTVCAEDFSLGTASG